MLEWLRTNLYLNRVLIIGIAALAFGMIALVFAVKREKRPWADAIALLFGGLVLTIVMFSLIWWLPLPPGDRSHPAIRYLVEFVFLMLALAVVWAGNRLTKRKKTHRS